VGRIEGTGKAEQRRRLRFPKVRLEPLVLIFLFLPIVLWAPTPWIAAVALAVVVQASWSKGHEAGVEDMAREVERELR
jgi:hypothetical protein